MQPRNEGWHGVEGELDASGSDPAGEAGGAGKIPSTDVGPSDPPRPAGRPRRLTRFANRMFERSRNEGSLRIALFMVVVSLATGPITYLTTDHADNAAELNNRRVQETVEDAYLRRSVDTTISHEVSLLQSYVWHQSTYDAHVAAGEIAAADDFHHSLGAQAEWDQVLALWGSFDWDTPEYSKPLKRWTYPTEQATQGLIDSIAFARLTELEGSAKASGEEAGRERSIALQLVRLIAVLIGALLLFTLAQVTRPPVRDRFARVGVLAALGAFIGVAFVDQSLAGWSVALGSVAAMAFVAVGDRLFRSARILSVRRLRLESTSDLLGGESGGRGPSRLNVPNPGEMTTRFSRVVAIAIAGATLCGAWIGYVQADAFGRADDARFRAETNAISAMLAGEQAKSEALANLAAYQRSVEAMVGVWSGEQAVRHGHAMADHQAAEEATITLGHLKTTLSAMTPLVEIKPNHPYGPIRDPDFPIAYLADADREHYRLTALQYIEDDDAREWSERGSLYVRLLVILAVAVYLLGLAVVIQGLLVKLVFLAFGVGGVTVAALVTGWTLLDRPTSAAADAKALAGVAAMAYAEGKFQMATGEYDAARAAFARATVARDDFAQAHGELGDAIYSAGVQQADGFSNDRLAGSVLASIGHFETAIALRDDTFGNRVNLGFFRLLASFQATDASTRDRFLASSLEATNDAISSLSANPLPYVNLALAHLATGDTAAADRAYDDGFRLTRGQTYAKWLLQGALTDLELLRRYHPESIALADTYQESIIRELFKPDDGHREVKSPIKVEATVMPTTLRWRSELPGFQADTDDLVQVWYRRANPDEAWSVYGDATRLKITTEDDADRGRVAFFGPDADDPMYESELDDSFTTGACLPTGQYRVDLYMNGFLAERSISITADHDVTGWWARDLGLFACVPSDWKRVPATHSQPGFTDAYVDPSGTRGLVFARVHYAGPLDGADRINAVLDELQETGVSVVPAGLADDEAPPHARFFVGQQDETAQSWVSDGTDYRAQAGATAQGTVLVGILFGPTGFLDEDVGPEADVGRSFVYMTVLGLRPPAPR